MLWGWMAGIRIERVGDTRHDSGTARNSPEGTNDPFVQRRRIDGVGGWRVAAAESVLLCWIQCYGRDKTTHSSRSSGHWIELWTERLIGRCLDWRLSDLKDCSIELAIAALRLRSYRDSCSPHSSVERQVCLNGLESYRGHG